MIIALGNACYSNEDMPELLAQYSYISNLREEMMELFCCSGISTLNTKFNISLLLALLAYSTQNQKTQMCDYIRSPGLAMFVLTTDNDRQQQRQTKPITLPLAHARGVNMLDQHNILNSMCTSSINPLVLEIMTTSTESLFQNR